MAARLGRGFVPVGLLEMVGLASLFYPGGAVARAWPVVVGALVAGAAMLAYGLRVTQKGFGHEDRPWMGAAMLGSVAPPVFALYALGWRGLTALAVSREPRDVMAALLFTVLGGWVMRAWMRVVEVERLAKVMQLGADLGRSR